MNIHTQDLNLEITGVAVKGDGTPYTLSELAIVNILIESPDKLTTIGPLTATLAADGSFSYVTSNAPFGAVGFWGFQTEYTLTNGQKIHSDILYHYVGRTIIPVSTPVNALSIGGETVLIGGEILVLQ